jgi:MarR family transcriptional regulator, multiple antibiotic resistance protein MarR
MAAYDPRTYDLRNAVPFLMARVRTELFNAVDAELQRFELRAPDYLVLAGLANAMGDTASAMCSFISHDPGAMTRKIDALEQKNLVRRVRSVADRRAIKLELTPEGKAVYSKALTVVVGVINRFLDGFSRAEVRELEGMLKRMLQNAGAFEEATPKEAKR